MCDQEAGGSVPDAEPACQHHKFIIGSVSEDNSEDEVGMSSKSDILEDKERSLSPSSSVNSDDVGLGNDVLSLHMSARIIVICLGKPFDSSPGALADNPCSLHSQLFEGSLLCNLASVFACSLLRDCTSH
uniref:Uncharacterized protein n=1 Tax=Callorhinchus milii TaxID=7868 RepID=A0A4W3HUP4_CALMI